MKLNEIKPVYQGEYNLSEGVIPVHLMMTLGQVVRDGGITNNVQYFVLAGLVEMFKKGGPVRWPRDLNDYSMTTNVDIIEDVKSLSPIEAVGIATWLMEALQAPVDFERNPYAANPLMSTVNWVRWVLQRQD